MGDYLKIEYFENEKDSPVENTFLNRNIPFADSNVVLTSIQEFKLLTKGQDVKRVYDLKLSRKDIDYDFLPGDTLSILPCNDSEEVDNILTRLNIIKNCDWGYSLNILENTTKKNPSIPKHVPPKSTLRHIFLNNIDIRTPPKKIFLKALTKYTSNSEDGERLKNLSLPKSEGYVEFISGKGRTLLGLLEAFPSCLPPIEIIIENSAPLQPRAFSISSSPLVKECIHITFFVVENNDGTKGVCTGWLEKLITNENLTTKIPMYFRKSNSFQFPKNISDSIIMVATGTGISPFKSFIDHRKLLQSSNPKIGNAILFYGCRYCERDCLYKANIEEYCKTEILSHAYFAYSRDDKNKCYVQDVIRENSEVFLRYLVEQQAKIYICGNTSNMMRDVISAVNDICRTEGNLGEEFVTVLEKENRLILDKWL